MIMELTDFGLKMSNTSTNKIFCQYQTSYVGKCLMYQPDLSERCDRHKGLIEKTKRVRQPKFRGDSKWQKENGYFDKK